MGKTVLTKEPMPYMFTLEMEGPVNLKDNQVNLLYQAFDGAKSLIELEDGLITTFDMSFQTNYQWIEHIDELNISVDMTMSRVSKDRNVIELELDWGMGKQSTIIRTGEVLKFKPALTVKIER